jgi:AraC family ethanolamine operon transcriptional activator
VGEFASNDPSGATGRMAEALAQAGSFTSEDPWVQEQATVPWDITVQPLSRGPYNQQITFLASPRLILYRESYRIATRLQGLSPPGMFAFAVPLQVGSNTSWWGAPLHETGLPAMMPGGMHVDLSAGQRHLVVLIDIELFHKSVPKNLRDAIKAATCQHVLPASRDAVARLGARLEALLDEARSNSSVLQHPQAVRSMEQDLLAAFCQSLTLPKPAPRHVGGKMRQRGLRRAVEYLRSTDTGLVTVADVCRVAQVSERTLEYAFRETFGLSPLRFLHLRCYHAIRRDLLAADPNTATVTEIAQSNGFYQMGRFAARYKLLFGESPSQTLKNSPVEMPCCFPRW